MITVHSSFL